MEIWSPGNPQSISSRNSSNSSTWSRLRKLMNLEFQTRHECLVRDMWYSIYIIYVSMMYVWFWRMRHVMMMMMMRRRRRKNYVYILWYIYILYCIYRYISPSHDGLRLDLMYFFARLWKQFPAPWSCSPATDSCHDAPLGHAHLWRVCDEYLKGIVSIHWYSINQFTPFISCCISIH